MTTTTGVPHIARGPFRPLVTVCVIVFAIAIAAAIAYWIMDGREDAAGLLGVVLLLVAAASLALVRYSRTVRSRVRTMRLFANVLKDIPDGTMLHVQKGRVYLKVRYKKQWWGDSARVYVLNEEEVDSGGTGVHRFMAQRYNVNTLESLPERVSVAVQMIEGVLGYADVRRPKRGGRLKAFREQLTIPIATAEEVERLGQQLKEGKAVSIRGL